MKTQNFWKIAKILGLFFAILAFFESCKTISANKDEVSTKLKVKFLADTLFVEKNDSIKLHWNVEGADNIEIKNLKDKNIVYKNLPATGNLSILAENSAEYRLTASKKENKRNATLTFKVGKPEIKQSWGTENLIWGQTAQLFWNTAFTQYVTVEGFEGKFLPEDHIDFLPDTTKIYKIIAHGKFNSDTTFVCIKVNLISEFFATEKCFEGEKIELKWNVSKVQHLEIENFGKNLPAKCDTTILIQKTTTFKLKAKRKNEDSIIVIEKKVIANEPEVSFSGPISIIKGEKAILSWNVKGANRVKLVGIKDSLRKSGSFGVTPNKTTTYELEIFWLNKSKKYTYTVDVIERRAFIRNSVKEKDVKAGKRIDFDILAIDRTKYPDSISIYFVCVDEQGNFIEDLNNKSFGTYLESVVQTDKNNKEIAVEKFKLRKEKKQISNSYDISLVLDYSGSMSSTIDSLETAVEKFISQLRPSDKLSIVKFDSRIKTLTNEAQKSEDAKKIFKKRGLADFGGCTALYAGIDQGWKDLKKTENNRVVVVFTDGGENSSFAHADSLSFSATQVAQHFRNNGTKLIIVGFGEGVNAPILQQLSEYCDGNYYQIQTTDDIRQVYKEIPVILNQYYVLTFKPLVFEGKHSIKLNYRNRVGGISSTKTDLQIGEKFTIDESSFSKEKTYWNDTTVVGKSLVGVPQAVAFFNFNESELEEQYKIALKKYAEYLKKKNNAEIIIYGHTDKIGNRNYCKKLSQERAEEVKRYLINEGVREKQISIRACGMEFPLWEVEDKDWKARENRRIEITLYE